MCTPVSFTTAQHNDTAVREMAPDASRCPADVRMSESGKRISTCSHEARYVIIYACSKSNEQSLRYSHFFGSSSERIALYNLTTARVTPQTLRFYHAALFARFVRSSHISNHHFHTRRKVFSLRYGLHIYTYCLILVFEMFRLNFVCPHAELRCLLQPRHPQLSVLSLLLSLMMMDRQTSHYHDSS